MSIHAELLINLAITDSDVQEFADNDIGLFGIDLRRVSCLLMAQLTHIKKYRVLNSFSVTDQMQYLEGVRQDSAGEKEKQFRHEPLKGFWKKHFIDASFIFRNCINELGIQFENSNKLGSILNKVAKEEERSPSRYGWQGRLAHEVTIGALESRARRKAMTGEWLIFGRHQEKNYYLCLAEHSNTREGDSKIYGSIKSYCAGEFPFLFANET